MKKVILFLMIAVVTMLSTSCDYMTSTTNDDSSNVPDTIGYYAARNLEGLGMFKIEKSTYSQTLKSLEGESFVKEFEYDTTQLSYRHSYFDRKVKLFGNPKFKKIHLKYYDIGDITIESLELKFYDNILYQIRFEHNDEVIDGFKYKYGNGKNTDDKIIWENKSLIIRAYKYKDMITIETKNANVLDKVQECNDIANKIKDRLDNEHKIKNFNKL